MEPGYYTRQELFSQPDAWAAVLELIKELRQNILDLKPAIRFDNILYTGCGSTYYLSLAAASLDSRADRPALPCFPGFGVVALPGIFIRFR